MYMLLAFPGSQPIEAQGGPPLHPGFFVSLHPVPVFFKHLLKPDFCVGSKVGDLPFRLFPALPEPVVFRMERNVPRHGPDKSSRPVEDPHDHAPVVFALRRARPVDGAPDEIPIRAEEPAGSRMLIYPARVGENRPFVFINPGDERRAGRDRGAGKLERADLAFDPDIVAHIHTTFAALFTLKDHQFTSGMLCSS